jgi:hypothetical protein
VITEEHRINWREDDLLGSIRQAEESGNSPSLVTLDSPALPHTNWTIKPLPRATFKDNCSAILGLECLFLDQLAIAIQAFRSIDFEVIAMTEAVMKALLPD